MSKRLLYILGILLTGIIGGIINYFIICKDCCNNKSCGKKSPPVAQEKTPELNPTKNGLVFSDGSNDLFKTEDNFNFQASGFEIIQPVAPSIDAGIDKLKAYLDANPDKTIDITGLHTSREGNNSAYPDLGIARGIAIKNYLVSKGIDSKSINEAFAIDDSMVADAQGVFYGPVNFAFGKKKDADVLAEELAALKQEIHDHPVVPTFNYNSGTINLNETQKGQMFKISQYLDKAEDGKLLLVGHTDSDGDAQANVALGLKRANSVKDYLVTNGVDAHKIEVSSKGESMPIAPNDTEEGRAQNRRVEISL